MDTKKYKKKKGFKIVLTAIVVILITFLCFLAWGISHTVPGITSGNRIIDKIPLGSHWKGDLLEMELEIYSDRKSGEGWLTWENERIHYKCRFDYGAGFNIARFEEEFAEDNFLLLGSAEYIEESDELRFLVFNWFGERDANIEIVFTRVDGP